jgi:hypothetical protein
LTFLNLGGMKDISCFSCELIEKAVENENTSLLANVVSNYDASSTVCLPSPSVTRNQEIMISRVKAILGSYLL